MFAGRTKRIAFGGVVFMTCGILAGVLAATGDDGSATDDNVRLNAAQRAAYEAGLRRYEFEQLVDRLGTEAVEVRAAESAYRSAKAKAESLFEMQQRVSERRARDGKETEGVTFAQARAALKRYAKTDAIEVQLRALADRLGADHADVRAVQVKLDAARAAIEYAAIFQIIRTDVGEMDADELRYLVGNLAGRIGALESRVVHLEAANEPRIDAIGQAH